MMKYRVLGAAGVAVTSLLLSGCVDGTAGDQDPNWKVSLNQEAEASEMAIDLASKAEPQFKTDNYSATLVPLGVSEKGDRKVTRFAMLADLPRNCTTRDNELVPPEGSGACVDFLYGSRTALVDHESKSGKDYQAPLHRGNGRVFVETTNGISTFELVTPVDADTTSVYLIADGHSVTLDPATGRPHGAPFKETTTTTPSQEPTVK